MTVRRREPTPDHLQLVEPRPAKKKKRGPAKLIPLGEAMEQIRSARGLTQGQVMQRMGVAGHNWWRWATGSTKMSLENARALADALRCSIDALAGRDQAQDERAARDLVLEEFLRVEPEVHEDDRKTLASAVFHGRRPPAGPAAPTSPFGPVSPAGPRSPAAPGGP